jgi:hypothetical protein
MIGAIWNFFKKISFPLTPFPQGREDLFRPLFIKERDGVSCVGSSPSFYKRGLGGDSFKNTSLFLRRERVRVRVSNAVLTLLRIIGNLFQSHIII